MHRAVLRLIALFAITSLLYACSGGGSGGGGGGGTPPTTQPTVQPSPLYANCAGSGSTPSTVAQRRIAAPSFAVLRHPPFRFTPPSAGAPSLIAVTYDAASVASAGAQIAAGESRAGARFVGQERFSHAGLIMRVLAVPPQQAASIETRLRANPGVQSVGVVDARRYLTSVSHAYFSNDPYFAGFSTTVADTAEDGAGATPPPATYHVAPYEERADVPGQWGMHAICLGDAFEYSQSGNGSGITNANALGSSAVKIALIDTGVDMTHRELSSKVAVYERFVNSTGPNAGTAGQTDQWGHGTDTAGIAGADMNNSLGFVGSGGNVTLYEYQVFPVPDSNCTNPNTTDPACSASTGDIANAIENAISRHVNVISISLGGSCPDATDEQTAIEDAVAANIIVVAAAGNDGKNSIDAPACDPNVIAVGATSLADGHANGSGNSNGSAASPYEYVASYSNFGSPGEEAGSPSAWGIVAPGGDGASSSDADDLHWIENIWTSTPFSSQDAGNCTGDYPSDTGATDCRIAIAGTSMATPLVAGAAALIVSVNAAYQSPTAMKQLLCETADDIRDPHEGCGRLNIYRAMAKALGDPIQP